jgi:hypothetical protein
MRELETEAALLTLSAGAGLISGAEQELAQPQREPLLTDAALSVKEQAGGQSATIRCGAELFAQSRVTVEFDKRH